VKLIFKNGDDVLDALGMKGHSFQSTMKQLGFLSLGNLILSWLGLAWKESMQRRNYSRGESIPSIPPKTAAAHGDGVTSSQDNVPLKVPHRLRM
jgi:hypothetical protein